MAYNRRQILIGLTVLAALVGSRPDQALAARELVVTTYGGVWEKFWRAKLLPAFTIHSGIQPRLDVGLGRSYVANLRSAGIGHGPYGVIMTNEIYAEVLEADGHLTRLDPARLPALGDLYPIALPGDDACGVMAMISPIGLGYRTDLVRRPPRSWRDLWDNPDFKGRTGLYSIQNTAGKLFLLLAAQIFSGNAYDLDAGFARLAALKPVIQSDFNMSALLARGEVAIAPFDFGEIARLRRQGLPVDCIMPEEGLLMWDQTLTIPKGAPIDLAHAYIDYLLSAEAQGLLMREFFVSPVNRQVEVPADLRRDVPVSGAEMNRFLRWDWDFLNRNAEMISRRWNETLAN